MLRVEREGDVVVWKIARPEAKNALSIEVLDLITLAAADAARDRSLRAAILTGDGGVFASGGDLRELKTMTSAEDAARFADAGGELCDLLEQLPIPVIAAVEGIAFGGGAELALACDLRIAAMGARFSFKQVRLGVTPAWGTTARLRSLVGAGTAARLLYTAHEIPAMEAKLAGLVDDVTSDGSTVTTAMAWASDVAQGSPSAVAEMKGLLRAARAPRPELRALERDRFVATWVGADHREAMAAYFERRPPRWS